MNTVELIQSFDPHELFEKICSETSEIAAQVILCMEAPKALIVFEKFPLETQIPVYSSVAELNKVTHQELDKIHEILSGQPPETANENGFEKSGIDTAMDLMFLTLNSDMNKVTRHLEKNNKKLYDSIIEKIYVFEDLVLMSKDERKRLFSEIDNIELAMALKEPGRDIQECLLSCIPSEKANIIKKELENAEKFDDVDSRNMQYKIITHIKNLENSAYEKALADANESIRLDPNNAENYITRAEVFLRLKSFFAGYNKQERKLRQEKALADANEAIRLDPNNARYYHVRSGVFIMTDKWDKARADANEAIRLDPGNKKYQDALMFLD